MSELPQVEVARVVMRRKGEEVEYVAQVDDWMSLLEDAAVASILHSAAAELATLANTFGLYEEEDVIHTLPPIERRAAAAIAERRGGRPPFRLPPSDRPTDGGDDAAA